MRSSLKRNRSLFAVNNLQTCLLLTQRHVNAGIKRGSMTDTWPFLITIINWIVYSAAVINNKNSIAIHFCDLQKSANSQSEQKIRWKVQKLSLQRIRVDRWYKKWSKSFNFKLFPIAFFELSESLMEVFEKCELFRWVYTAKSCDHTDSRNSKKSTWWRDTKNPKVGPPDNHKQEDFLSNTNTDGRTGSRNWRSSRLHAPLGEQKTSTVERKWIVSSLVAVQVLFFSVPCCRFVCGLACLSVLFACWTRPAGSFCSNTFALVRWRKREVSQMSLNMLALVLKSRSLYSVVEL